MASGFGRAIYTILGMIPAGRVTTYGEIARAVGRPGAARAAGQVLNRNPRLGEVPCHRVVYADGRIGGYRGGVSKKIKLLRFEGVTVVNNQIENFEQQRYSFGFSE